jgi:hypothetical protein
MRRSDVRSLIGAAILAAMVFIAPARAEEPGKDKISLRLAWKPGETRRLRLSLDYRTTHEDVPGEKISKAIIVYRFRVLAVDKDGTADCLVTYERFMEKEDRPGNPKTSEYDSAKPPAVVPDEWKAMAAAVGRGFSLRITSLGRVVEVRGADALAEQLVNALKDVPEETRPWLEDWAQTMFSESNTKAGFNGLFDYLAKEPVAVGDTWSRVVAVNHGLPRIS